MRRLDFLRRKFLEQRFVPKVFIPSVISILKLPRHQNQVRIFTFCLFLSILSSVVMATGYQSVIYRLSGVLPSGGPSLTSSVEVLQEALKAYFLDDALDEVSLDLSFRNFAIPALLTLLHDFMSSHPHRIRLNEYMYRRLPDALSLDEQYDCVFGAMSLVVDAGSLPNVPLESTYLEEFMYELFPDLENFLRLVNPCLNPFTTGPLDLTRFADYLASIQVCLFYDFKCLTKFSSSWTGCVYVS